MDLLVARLFPERCGGCGCRGSGFCRACSATLTTERFVIAAEPPLEVVALGRYRGPLRRAILAMKRGRRDVTGALASALSGLGVEDGELVVAAPTSRARRARRGFDQALILARALGETQRAQLALDGASQRGAARAVRLARRVRFARGEVRGRRVVVVDDVCATGGTLLACAQALRAAGAVAVRAAVLARAERSAE